MIKTIYKIQWRIQTFREGGGGGGGGGGEGGGGYGQSFRTWEKGGGGFPKALVDPSGLSLF